MNLMVVDDDIQIREGITYGIQWKSLGIEKTECYPDAFQALQAIKEENYDIVLTDISMPGLSGIELLKQIKERNPEVIVILISGYEEFEYAKAGIQYGADNYILKPIHLDELTDIIQKTVEKIRKIKKNQDTIREAEKLRFVKGITDQTITDNKKIKMLLNEFYGFERGGPYMLVILQKDEKKELLKPGVQNRTLIRVITDRLAGYPHCILSVDEDNTMVLIHVCNSALFLHNLKAQIMYIVSEINEKAATEGTVSACVQAPITETELGKCWKKGMEMLERKFFMGPTCFISEDILDKNTAGDMEAFEKKRKEFVCYFKMLSRQQIEDFFEIADKALRKNSCRYAQNCVLLNLMQLTQNNSVSIEEDIPERIFACKYFDELMEFWRKSVDQIKDATDKTQGYSREVKGAIEYIKQHYAEKITIADIAESQKMSDGHFSRIFKNETGESVKKYLNNFRISLARKLLLETNMKIYEVGECVGIPEYLYFVQVFKNIEGVSPSEYRKESEI